MFPHRYFPEVFFTDSFWPPDGASLLFADEPFDTPAANDYTAVVLNPITSIEPFLSQVAPVTDDATPSSGTDTLGEDATPDTPTDDDDITSVFDSGPLLDLQVSILLDDEPFVEP